MYVQLILFLLYTSFHFFPRTFIDSERNGAQRQDHYHKSIKLFNSMLTTLLSSKLHIVCTHTYVVS